jgi:hypothetical protein
LTIKDTAATFGVAPSTIHRLLNDGIIAGEQLTPGADALPGKEEYEEIWVVEQAMSVCCCSGAGFSGSAGLTTNLVAAGGRGTLGTWAGLRRLGYKGPVFWDDRRIYIAGEHIDGGRIALLRGHVDKLSEDT